MNGKKQLILTLGSIVVFATVSAPVSARFKCWTNHEGVRECGEKVPPEFAQQGHQEVSKQGVVVGKKERAKTKEELQEEARLAAIAKKEKKIADEKAKQDKILLDTFTSVSDIETVRDDKIAVIESSITLTKKRSEKTQEDLDKRIQAAAAAERAGNAPDEALLKDIEDLRSRIKNNNAFIEGKRKEQGEVKAAAEADIARFKSLKGL